MQVMVYNINLKHLKFPIECRVHYIHFYLVQISKHVFGSFSNV